MWLVSFGIRIYLTRYSLKINIDLTAFLEAESNLLILNEW